MLKISGGQDAALWRAGEGLSVLTELGTPSPGSLGHDIVFHAFTDNWH